METFEMVADNGKEQDCVVLRGQEKMKVSGVVPLDNSHVELNFRLEKGQYLVRQCFQGIKLIYHMEVIDSETDDQAVWMSWKEDKTLIPVLWGKNIELKRLTKIIWK